MFFPVLFNLLSHGQNDKWLQLEKKIESIGICQKCIDDYSEKEIDGLFSVFNKDLKTDVFDNLEFRRQISLSFCNSQYQEGEYLDCIYITELEAPTQEIADKIFDKLNRLPNVTIHYLPPQYWKWIKRGDKIYFLYSNAYPEGSPEFDEIKKYMYQIF